ncbi:MAG: hypothetical protein A2725_03485 [Candidatus Magasanikbacteria bacterium RIFCSPHIGHO2_01_FULL_33_34]|uniref:LTD domain-containing protein n=1 Tax=Candidatus Magasanikbacteria bacterium RIFCSPHIGHO2_01_FULL_33_34 TaxID=1798671 RepID=A0A1F6LH49_9BACT|nr:MAG: hypothetical protein A2725_03485 [Candidatus Magasanikbacteria bacterium RIFCSPHIGHO2_01_FULL_33_34]OGH66191.1 MAG: hypothetical protein A3B83_00975 [Candidatus Magasanikbacteria bacterium RIFCSPHIGHO2_02_FULL_33_17]OGH76037.1 MAG: hypothetical protein A3A89_00885 [Candidatus Magasanikbacteria bacterium RIFCSPLOWO2_01_FULL_33_34]OGH82642.1 MAG: hypothetical protein A3F93_02355 [Candidatus Magasanikbacteria bacterium RIFCSPLOWO2_12_FULL_34_7]
MKKIFLSLWVLSGIFLFLGNVYANELININIANIEELDTLPGIGIAKAQAIVDYRELNGSFATIEDIMNVSGIGQVTYDNMKDLITVDTVVTEEVTVIQSEPSPVPVTNYVATEFSESELLGYEVHEVVINEFLSDAFDEQVEFVELYNNSQYVIDLTGWWIEEGSGKKSILGGSVMAQDFFVLEHPKGSLNNTGDIIKLFDPTGGLIDQVVYGSWDDGNINNNAPKADDPFAVARVYDGQDTDMDSIDFVITMEITKGIENIIYIESDEEEYTLSTSTKIYNSVITNTTTIKNNLENIGNKNSQRNIEDVNIIITEILPNPAGSDSTEMIELYNPTNEDFDLTGLRLDDEEGGSRPYKIPDNTFIKAGEYMVFGKWDTKIALNNTIDSARLLWLDDTVVDEIDYVSVVEGASFSRDEDDEWQWTTQITPGVKNTFSKPLVKIVSNTSGYKLIVNVSLSEIRTLEVGTQIKTKGIVSVMPNIFGTQYFYITDNIAGVQVYMYSKDFPEFEVGDEVEIVGEISMAYGETRVKIKAKKDIVVLDKAELVEQKIEINEITENYIGSYLQISGEITEKKSTYIYLDDGSEEIKVYFKKNANIDKSLFDVGDNMIIKGILGNSTSGVQLMPRFDMDIELIDVATSTDNLLNSQEIKKNNTEKYLTAIIIGLVLTLIGISLKSRAFFIKRFLKRFLVSIISFVKR